MLENIELFGNSLGTGTYPDGEGKSFLQNIFDIIHPVGETYIQYPAQKSPQEIYNKKDANNRIIIDSVWEEQLQYNSAFFRSEHLLGNYVYKADDETQYYLIDNLDNLTPINITGNNDVSIAGSPTSGQQKVIGDKTYQAYAVSGVNSSSNNYIEEGNGLSKQSNQNAYHNHNGNTGTESQGHVHYLDSNVGVIGGWAPYIYGGVGDTSLTGSIGPIDTAYEGSGDSPTVTGIVSWSNWSMKGSTGSGGKRITISINATHGHGGIYFNNSAYTSGAHQTHTHSITSDGSSADRESRPDNLTVKIWKRIS